MLHTIPILPHVARVSDVGRSNVWQETLRPGTLCNFSIMALRSTRSYAPIPSMDNTVACASASVINRTACPTQSVPALVDNANWNGEQTDSTVFPNCLAKVFAINLRKLVPVATPRAPPSFFCRAVIVADMNALTLIVASQFVRHLRLRGTTIAELPGRPNRLSTSRLYTLLVLKRSQKEHWTNTDRTNLHRGREVWCVFEKSGWGSLTCATGLFSCNSLAALCVLQQFKPLTTSKSVRPQCQLVPANRTTCVSRLPTQLCNVRGELSRNTPSDGLARNMDNFSTWGS